MADKYPDKILEKVLDSLRDGSYACKSLVKLSGGNANFVYRGILVQPLPDGSETVVIKHTEYFVASNPDAELTTTRCKFEQAILTALEEMPPVTSSGITVESPKMYSFLEASDSQVYSDLPSSTELKTYVLTHPLTKAQGSSIGQALGKWSNAFHRWTAAPQQAPLRETMKSSHIMKKLKYTIYYSRLLDTIEKFPHILEENRETFNAVAKDAKEVFDSDECSLIHGDFWTGNILLKNAPMPEPGKEEALKIYIVDWEFSHLSHTAFDLGQLFAEMYELKLFKNIDAGVWLIEGFIQGYGKVEEDVAFRIAIHLGIHLICWVLPVAGWGSEKQIEKVVEVGNTFVVKAWQKDKNFFKDTPLKSLFT